MVGCASLRPNTFAYLSALALVVIPVNSRAEVICPPGLVSSDGIHCCWPGQTWSAANKACAGEPECPAGYSTVGANCIAPLPLEAETTQPSRSAVPPPAVLEPAAMEEPDEPASGDSPQTGEDSGPEPDFDLKKFVTVVQEVRDLVARLRKANDALLAKADELAAFAVKLNATAADSSSSDKNKKLHNRFPATQMIDLVREKDDRFETAPSAIRAKIRENGEFLAALQVAAERAQRGDKALSGRDLGLLLSCPDAVGWDTEGFFKLETGEGYAIERIPIESPTDIIGIDKDLTPAALSVSGDVGTLMFRRCTLASMVRTENAPTRIRLRWIHFLLFDLGRFREVCSKPLDEQDELGKLRRLAAAFPDDEALQRSAKKAEEACESFARYHCSGVFKIRETWALAYETQACVIRKVTSSDLHGDVEGWYGATEVEKQEHLLLSDRIEACRTVDEAGFHWTYEEPTPSDSCLRKKKASGKRTSSP